MPSISRRPLQTAATVAIFLCSLIAVVRCDQKFAIEAEDVTAVIGTTVVLPCRVVQKQGVLQWTKDDFGLGSDRNLSAFDRYTMTGNDEDGDYSLRIEAVTIDDDARFQCQVSPGPEGQPGIRSRFVQLTVITPAEQPRITQGDFLLVTENNEFEVECVSIGGKPAADLTWIDGQGNGVTAGVRYTTEPWPADPRRFVAKSTLKLRPQKLHHNTTLMCQSQNAADRRFKTAEVKIEVKYAPKLELVIENTDGSMTTAEGSEARFKCKAEANPSDITYKWFLNNELIVGDYTTEMVIHSVNRTHHESTVKCEATNDIGFEEATIELDVKYPPVFKQLPKSIEADEKEKVTLFCDVDGNPLEIVWVHDPTDRLNHHPRVVGNDRKLKLTVTAETAGRYYCKASVAGYPEIKSEAFVYVKRAPHIDSPRQQYGSSGDTLRLECAAFSVPKARHVSWSYNGREIQMGDSDREFTVLEEATVRGIKSTLVIRDSQEWHFGKYNCTVVNDYGVDVLPIELLHQNNFQFLVIIVGATSGVVILVIVVVLVLCVKLKGKQDTRSQKEKDLSADIIPEKHSGDRCWNNKDGDGSSHSSDYKPDIKASSSESDYSIASTNVADSTLDFKEIRRNGTIPLAGPIEMPINYRHSVDYADEYFPPKYAPPTATASPIHYNNSYVTRTDYARYCSPAQQKFAAARQLSSTSSSMLDHALSQQQQQQQQLQNNSGQPHQLYHARSVSTTVPTNVVLPMQDNGLPGARSSLIV